MCFAMMRTRGKRRRTVRWSPLARVGGCLVVWMAGALLAAGLVVMTAPAAMALDRSADTPGVDARPLLDSPISLSGLGVGVGILGGKIDPDHPALLVAGNAGTGPPEARATEAAGVIGSGDSIYTGLAPAALLYGYGPSSRSELFEGANWLTRPEQGASIVLYSRTWPLAGAPLDGSSPESMHVDHLAGQRDVLFVIPGNEQSGGAPLPSDAYNALTINALAMTYLPEFGYERYDQTAAWNYYGEAPSDGRSKPDLLAPGGHEGPGEHDPESIRTTTLGGGLADRSNTTVAAAHVAGTAALLTEYGRSSGLSTDHKVLKAVLINSAEKTIWDTDFQDWLTSEAYLDPAVPLDDQMGAGGLTASSAFYLYSAGEWEPGIVSAWGFDHNSVSVSQPSRHYHFGIPLAAGMPLTATLAWDRRVSLENDQDGDLEFDYGQGELLVAHELNNLDIHLYDQQGNLIGGSWSAVDNVEHLHWVVPEDGIYYLSVELSEARDLPEQSYALAWTVFPADVDVLYWQGGQDDWGSASWNDGTQVRAPAGGEQMVVTLGHVTVASDYLGADGPASLVLYGGEVELTPDGQLEAADAVSVADEAALLVDGSLTTGELFVEGDTYPGGNQGGVLAGQGTVVAREVFVFGTLSPGDPDMRLAGAGVSGAGGVSGAAGSAAVGAAVPEPGSLTLLLAAGVCLACSVRRLLRPLI